MAIASSATTRYGVEQAPGGLALVQDVVNTRAAGTPRQADLLDSGLPTARAWFADAAAQWAAATGVPAAGVPRLDEADLLGVRELRDGLTGLLRRPLGADQPVPLLGTVVSLELAGNGVAHLAPRGDAPRWLAGAILGEVFRAQATGVWKRLKVCRNTACSGAFYDLSKNNSRVWHDVRSCGNTANLRASRARRRTTAAPRA